jgi:hypothetical protein
MALAVSEIADRILAPGADKAALVERLRYWTREGLLSPIGHKHPGTGRQRQYEESAVFVAAVLNVLANRGIQIGEIVSARPGPGVRIGRQDVVLALTKHAIDSWQQKALNGCILFLVLATFADNKTMAYLDELPIKIFEQHDGGIAPVHSRADSSLVINITKLFGGLKEGNEENGQHS